MHEKDRMEAHEKKQKEPPAKEKEEEIMKGSLFFNKPLFGRFSVNWTISVIWTISVNWLNRRAKRRYKMHLPGGYVDFRSSLSP